MPVESEEIHKGVKEFYGQLAKAKEGGCCSGCCTPQQNPGNAETAGYTRDELAKIPEEASGSSFGCGNPLAFAEVRPGETVLDLGSGGGIDCFLAADRVGASGRVIGLDMTEQMVEKARGTAARNGYQNVEFKLGLIEAMPVADGSVDLVVSNCVINLSPEKEKVFSEAYRVLKPGGRVLISDVVAEGLPLEMREDMSAWASCVAGALTESEYLGLIRGAGFERVEIVDRLDYVKPSEEQPYQLSSIRVRAIKRQPTGKEEKAVNLSPTALDRETQLLVAAGAAVAAGCIPCLESIVAMARSEGIGEKKLKEAVLTGQYVKEQPANSMKAFADQLLGTHLQGKARSPAGPCPLSGRPGEDPRAPDASAGPAPGAGGCGCSSARG